VSRLLAELQEIEIGAMEQPQEQLESKCRHISIARQCLDMRDAARTYGAAMEYVPSLTYRLSRMDEEIQDPCIQALYQVIRGLDIDLQFGDPEDATQQAENGTPVQTVPSLDLNLDLSLLIALLSDITHADLPQSDEEAEARYQPVPRMWKRATSRTDGRVTEDRPAMAGEFGTEEHTRALTIQLKQEARSGLIDELSAAIDTMCDVRKVSPEHVRFWTTREAIERCHDIARKIAGPREAYRARHMFRPRDTSGDISPFWLGSRHQPVSGAMRTFAVGVLEEESSDIDFALHAPRSFARRLIFTCHRILSIGGDRSVIGRDENIRRASGHDSPTLKVPSAHTTRSMLAGVVRGMTTVTANRMSVRQILRNMGGLQGLEKESDLASVLVVVQPKTLAEEKRADIALNTKGHMQETAVFMITEPRSLSEAAYPRYE
jgi:hypothetical protein